jgi:glycosyltransferase involved in cell wall biosynthesis
MRVVIVGLPFFGKRLAENLNRFDKENSYVFLDTYSKKTDKLKALFKIPKADIVFSINGSLSSSGVFDLCLKKKTPLVMMWVGSDVEQAKIAVKNGAARLDYLQYAHHFCEVDWIKDELASIGISARIQNFAAFPSNYTLQVFQTAQLSVFCYVNDRDPVFYGMNELIRLAQQFPKINFEVVGTKADSFNPLPSNIHTHGWVQEMDTFYDKCQIVLRFPSHDGLATVVLEALARGKQVLYKYPFPHCKYVPTEEKLTESLNELYQQFEENNLKENMLGKKYVEENFNEEHIFSGLIQAFKALSK